MALFDRCLLTDRLLACTFSQKFLSKHVGNALGLPVTGWLPWRRLFVTATFGVAGSISVFAPAHAQGNFNPQLAPINLIAPQISQVPRGDSFNPTIIPTDVTPIGIGRERELQRPGYSFYLLQKLPPKLWFNATTEVTQRLETNVFFTRNDPKADYVFRVQPNITVGYKVLPKTSVYANWFLIKDVFAKNNVLTNPTFQSVSGGVLHDIPIKTRTNLQLQWQFRELWQNAGLRQADMIPGATLTHAFSPKLIGFANVQLQLRSRNLFVTGGLREIDPFYTLGLLYRYKRWNFVATNTFVTNYRYPNAIVPQNNLVMISDFEASHPISKKIPSLVAFVRAEPIFNWASRGVPGLSGFDFRLFSGLRWNVSKNAYDTELSKLRKYLKDPSAAPNSNSKSGKTPGSSPSQQSQPGADPNSPNGDDSKSGDSSSNLKTPEQDTSSTDASPADLTNSVPSAIAPAASGEPSSIPVASVSTDADQEGTAQKAPELEKQTELVAEPVATPVILK